MSDDDFGQHVEFFDLESELYTAMAEETEGLGPPELDLDRMRAAGRRRRMLLAGSGAAVALIGVTVTAVAVGGSGSGAPPGTSLGTSSGASPRTVPSGRPNPTGCDGMPKAVVPYFTGSAKPTTPPGAPTTPRTVVTTAVDGCRVVIQLPPYEIPGWVSSTGR